MNEQVLPFKNFKNFAKCQLFYHGPATNVIIQTILWLYKDETPIEKKIVELSKTRSIQNQNFINKMEEKTIKELAEGHVKLIDLDITLLYKVVKNICGLASKDDPVWTELCPNPRQKELEYLLLTLKNGRNYLSHPRREVKNITNSDVDDKSNSLKELLTEILREAGLRENVKKEEIDEAVEKMQSDMEKICKGKPMNESMKLQLKKLILEELKASYSEEMKTSSYKNELKFYSAPHFSIPEIPQSSVQMDNLLQAGDSQIFIVQGEPGEGKTAMTKFLFNCWMTETTEPVKGLETFDLVFRIECNSIFSSDVNKFYEDLLPNATYSFSNTSSLTRHFSEYKVLWVLDGYDERASGLTSFLKDLMKRFPDCHKLIITTRPHMLDDLKQCLPKSAFTLSIEKLRKDNILQIIKNMIGNDEKHEAFKKEFDLLDEPSKTLLATPLNLILHIELWLEDKSQAQGSYTIGKLFVRTTKLQLQRLLERERSKDSQSLSSGDLKRKIKRWFYSILCQISFINILQHRLGIIHSEDVILLKNGASNENLIESECLSAFLIKEKGSVSKSSYYYSHPFQQIIFGYLFLSKIGKHCESSLDDIMQEISSPDNWSIHSVAHLTLFVYFIVKMVFELNSSPQQIKKTWEFVKKLISKFQCTSHKCSLLHVTSVAANFDPAIMEHVVVLGQSLPCLDLTDINSSQSNIYTFLDFVHPKKITFSSLSDHSIVRPGFIDTLKYANAKQVECFLFQKEKWLSNHVGGATEIDILNLEYINIVGFIGKMTELSRLNTHHDNLKSVGVVIESESDVQKILQFLNRHSHLKDIRVFLNFDISQTFSNKNLYTFPRFRYYMTVITNSHNNLIDEISGRSANVKPSNIPAAALIDLSFKFVPHYKQENDSIELTIDILPTKYLQPFSIPKLENLRD